MPSLGAPLPALPLPCINGPERAPADDAGHVVAIVFWAVECHWARAYDAWLEARHRAWTGAGIALWLVDANADEDDAHVAQALAAGGLGFPVYRDPGQRLADVLGATHTPHVYVFGRDGRLVYQGALDDRTFRRRTATLNYLERAVGALQAGLPVEPAETQPYGCTIVRAS